ncbi:MAG: AbrB/MazE/SpoVT family DNA-binding domain-containing protein [Terracidiphilus sp.]|nr:AbrB/MazE/SpoVT family DNA-binding domain-containing protein [Terracidiphilus sp.]
MGLQARVQIGEKGRLVIPADFRNALGIQSGDTVILSYQDNQLRVETLRSRIRRAQERVRQLVPEGVSLSEELSAERREAAKYE